MTMMGLEGVMRLTWLLLGVVGCSGASPTALTGDAGGDSGHVLGARAAEDAGADAAKLVIFVDAAPDGSAVVVPEAWACGHYPLSTDASDNMTCDCVADRAGMSDAEPSSCPALPGQCCILRYDLTPTACFCFVGVNAGRSCDATGNPKAVQVTSCPSTAK